MSEPTPMRLQVRRCVEVRERQTIAMRGVSAWLERLSVEDPAAWEYIHVLGVVNTFYRLCDYDDTGRPSIAATYAHCFGVVGRDCFPLWVPQTTSGMLTLDANSRLVLCKRTHLFTLNPRLIRSVMVLGAGWLASRLEPPGIVLISGGKRSTEGAGSC
jgi:hypothetical protein